MKPYYSTVGSLMNRWQPKTILDTPSGNGWLKELLNFEHQIDGVDLFASQIDGYRNFKKADLDLGLPDELDKYHAIVSCEGIEHFGNPDLFLKSVRRHLVPGGRFIVTTPNTWFPAARLQFLFRGFFPSFPCLVGKISRGTHMHIMPWSYPQLYLFLALNGFTDIELHEVHEKKPKHAYERLFGLPQVLYCRNKRKKSNTEEERKFWEMAGSTQSVYGRRLVVSAVSP